MIRIALALLLVVAAAAALGLGTGYGRERLRDLKAHASHRAFMRTLDVRLSPAMIAMPDGIGLATDVYLPGPAGGGAARPAILIRLPYGKRRYHEVRHWLRLFLPRGYAVVVQDMRGRWGSRGVFAPYPNAAGDGGATLDWIAAQPWSDGKVGTIGCSALGESQILLGAARHPAHRAMIAISAGGAIGTARGQYGYFGIFEGGIPELASAVGWFGRFGGKTADAMAGADIRPATALDTLPMRDAVRRLRADPTDYEDLLDRFGHPGGFDGLGYVSDDARFATPALIVDSWYDQAVQASLALAGLMRETAPSVQVVVAPGTHCDQESAFTDGRIGDIAVAPGRGRDMDAIYADFMDHHLRDAPAPDLAPYELYALNQDRWHRFDNWPPARAEDRSLYLAGASLAATTDPDALPGFRDFRSDPANPVPSLGGSLCCTGDPSSRAGPVAQNAIEDRPDLLIYDTAPVADGFTIAGPMTADLWVSADVPDADLVVRLTDVDAGGRSILIQEGALRLRYRDGFDAPELMQPGQTYAVQVALRNILWHVAPGHRLRLHIAASSFPRLARNMQGGGDPHRETMPNPATIRIHDGPEPPSRVRLFTISGD